MGSIGQSQPELAIPIIDLSPIRSGSTTAAHEVGKQVYTAFRDVGFAYIRNHSVPQTDIDQAFEWSAKFFSLPTATKQLAPHPAAGWHHRGYSGVGREKVVQMVYDRDSISDLRQTPDLKESFELGRADDEETPNIYLPEESLPGFHNFMAQFFDTCDGAAKEILKAIELGMELPEGWLIDAHRRRDNQLRLLHYPQVEGELLRGGKVERIAAHTDFGTMTMLFQDKVGGLEVEDVKEKGKFNPAPFVEGAVVVNIGDFLQRWSNDGLKSTLHRVRAPPVVKQEDSNGAGMTRERYSIPYFVTADRDRVVDCLPGCWGEGRPKRYEAVNSREYIRRRLDATY